MAREGGGSGDSVKGTMRAIQQGFSEEEWLGGEPPALAGLEVFITLSLLTHVVCPYLS